MNSLSELKKIATVGIRSNLVQTSQGPLVPAGANQFQTLWVRDFCYAVRGLLSIDEISVVQNQLDLILGFQRADGLLPRGIDIVDPKLRVIYGLYLKKIPLLNVLLRPFFTYTSSKKLLPEYKGEHATIAFDSNILVLHSALDFFEKTKDTDWILKHEATFFKALDLYKSYFDGQTFKQPAFSDWQDSLKREGSTCYSHVLIFRLLQRIHRLGIFKEWNLENIFVDLAFLENKIYELFLKDDLWKYQSFESLSWCLNLQIKGFKLSEADLLHVWPAHRWGQPSQNVPDTEVSWTTRIVGLSGYHIDFHWSWLMAESYIQLHKLYPAPAAQVLEQLSDMCLRKNRVAEIYLDSQEYRNFLYQSEAPFSWGAGKTLEAIECQEKNPQRP